jgi:hypothetical protein
VPEIIFMDVDPILARSEPDAEIRDLIKASGGLNLAMDYLPGSLMYDPLINMPDAELASRIVWFDALVANVDRTARNTNMLMWHRRLWLIDHGAALYVHHGDDLFARRSREPFGLLAQHVLAPAATNLTEADEELAEKAATAVADIVALVPDELLSSNEGRPANPESLRTEYNSYLLDRLRAPRIFFKDSVSARE